MKKQAVVRMVKGERKFTFSFLLSIPGTERQFNLNRELVELPALFSERIGANVAKIVNKKRKKKEKEEEGPEPVGVEFCSGGQVLSLGRCNYPRKQPSFFTSEAYIGLTNTVYQLKEPYASTLPRYALGNGWCEPNPSAKLF
jgi:hypothetical protein